MRHALGVLGVLAAGVLLAVSAAMNWRFGFSLGRTEFDGQIYGAASAAADCMKALVPFFFFAAIRNRMWSQAARLGARLGRGHGLLADLGARPCGAEPVRYGRPARRDRRRLQGPSRRPGAGPGAIVLDPAAPSCSDGAGRHRCVEETIARGSGPRSCTEVTGSKGRSFCQKYHALSAELASAEQSIALEARIADIQGKIDEQLTVRR